MSSARPHLRSCALALAGLVLTSSILAALALATGVTGPAVAFFLHPAAAGAALAVSRLRWPQAHLPAQALCVLAIFKNETLNVREWASHYLWQGADALLLLDNGDATLRDGWRAELRGYEHFLSVLDAPLSHAQEPQYNDLGRPWLEARGCEFVAVLDLDEFLYVRAPLDAAPPPSLHTVVAAAFEAAGADAAQFSCPWLVFGSSGLHAHPRGHVRESFTWRAGQPHPLRKSVVRLSKLVRLRAHEHEVLGGVVACPRELALNHYAIQSREFFREVKMRRGDVCCSEYETVRSWDYFDGFDFREVNDTSLRYLVLQYSPSPS